MQNGKIIVDCVYNIVTELNKYGFAGIEKDGLWGTVDEDGNIVIEPTYEIESYYLPRFIGKYQLKETEAVYCLEL